jgi:methyl-accepting chemotaxis protein
MFKNTSIKTLLLMNLIFIVVLLIAVGSLSLYGLKQASASLQTVYDDRLIPSNDLGDMRVFLQKNRVNFNRLVIFHDDVNVVNTVVKEIENNKAEWDRLWNKYLATYLTEEEKQLVAVAKTTQTAYFDQLLQPALAAIKAQNFPELERLLKEQAPVVFPAIEKALDDVNELQPRVAKEEFEKANSRYELIFDAVLG